MIVTFGALGVFFVVIVVVLHISKNRQSVATFSNYAVGERSFSSWFVSMAYTNSWWPGSTFTAVFGLTVASGVIGLYFLVYSVLGVLAMYFIARPVWKWGKKFDLRTQADLLDLRYNSRGLKLIGSTLRSRTSGTKAQILSGVESLLWEKFATGKLRPVIHQTLPMSTHAEAAHAILQNQENIGKVVLILDK